MSPWGPVAYPNAESRGNYLLEPSIKDVETWLDWQACQLDTLCWWVELTAIPRVEDPKKLAQKIWASFSFQKLEARSSQAKGIPHPAPKCLTWNVFLLDELSYQDVMAAFSVNHRFAQGLQYWVERLNLPVDPDFHPLAQSVLELRERVIRATSSLLNKSSSRA